MNRNTLVFLLVLLGAIGTIAVVYFTVGPGRTLVAPPPPPPPGPSTEEIYTHIKPSIKPFEDCIQQKMPLQGVVKDQLMESLRQTVSLYEGSDNGRAALAHLADDVRDLVRQAREEDRWGLVDKGTDIFGVFRRNPFFMSFYKELAQLELNRPKVTLKGFFEDHAKGDTYAFIEVAIRDKPELETVKVRPGEEFLDPPYTMKFIEIIGANSGVQLEYLAIPGDFIDVMLP